MEKRRLHPVLAILFWVVAGTLFVYGVWSSRLLFASLAVLILGVYVLLVPPRLPPEMRLHERFRR